jgi:hypothetical protein
MPRLCRLCHAESDNEECIYCAGPTVEVKNIYELRYSLTCLYCGSHVTKKMDHDRNDMLGWDFFIMHKCPVCDMWTMHERRFLGSNLTSYDSFLEDAYEQELRKE